MTLIFYLLALVTVVSAMMVVSRPNAVHSAMWLVLTFLAVAGLFILQGAEFLAAVQVLVYAGGIMVLFLFVIMLVNIEKAAGFVRSRVRLAAAIVLSVLLVATVGSILALSGTPGAVPVPTGGWTQAVAADGPVPGREVDGNLEAVGMQLLTTYLMPFEVVSVLLLVAVVGAIVLCRQDL
ncbi:MAG: NADH-quinone oxidoreductase subunit J [Acidobacteriota bacterium]